MLALLCAAVTQWTLAGCRVALQDAACGDAAINVTCAAKAVVHTLLIWERHAFDATAFSPASAAREATAFLVRWPVQI